MWQLDGSWVRVRAPNRVPFWVGMEEKRSFRCGRSAPSMWSPGRSEGGSGTVRGRASGRGRVPPRLRAPRGSHVVSSQGPCQPSVSCKAGDAACRVTALPGGNRQSPGSGREWGASWGLRFSSCADSLTLQLACGRTNEVEKIHGK